MKKQLLYLVLFLTAGLGFSQEEIDSLVQLGVKYHDNGQYELAIKQYKKALAIEPQSSLVNYELAMTYMYAGDYEKAVKYSDIVLAQNGENLLPAYITKGSSLDYLGKTEESIKLFEEALNKFGDHYLLNYNLAYNYSKLEDYEKATDNLVRAIINNPQHPSSHYLLGEVMRKQNNRIQSLLSLYYFLFLEPNSERSKTAFQHIKEAFNGNIEKDNEKPNDITINLNPSEMDSEFAPAIMMISMIAATQEVEGNKDRTETEIFTDNSGKLFKILGELKKDKDGFWWNFYVPFFYDLAQSKHLETFCNYISLSSREEAMTWLQDHESKLEDFGKWLQE